MSLEFEVILPVASKDVAKLSLTIRKLRQNVKPQKIVVISNKINKEKAFESGTDEFIDEEQLLEQLTLDRIKILLQENGGTTSRAGWYFQQFLKMAYSYKCTNEYYLIWDADTIPLRKINFFNNDEKFLFTMGPNYHPPIFKTIDKLFSGELNKPIKNSLVAEHMIIKKQYMIELLNKIEKIKEINGITFFEKIMYAIDKKDINFSGFSEFETYGNYILKYYPNAYEIRRLKMLREGSLFIDENMINDKVLKWISKKYDTVSFEEHFYPNSSKKLRNLLKIIVRYRIVSFNMYKHIYMILFRMINFLKRFKKKTINQTSTHRSFICNTKKNL